MGFVWILAYWNAAEPVRHDEPVAMFWFVGCHVVGFDRLHVGGARDEDSQGEGSFGKRFVE